MAKKGVNLSDKAKTLIPSVLEKEYKAGLSDALIAEKYSCSEAYVQQKRKDNNIKTILKGVGRQAEKIAIRYLKDKYPNEKIVDLNKIDPHSTCDVLLGKLRIEVKGSKVMMKKGGKYAQRDYPFFCFALADDGTKSLNSLVGYKRRLGNTTTVRRDYPKICDFLICVAIDENNEIEFFYVIPSKRIPEVNAISIYRNNHSKYDCWYNPDLDLRLVGERRREPIPTVKITVCKKCGQTIDYNTMRPRYCFYCRRERLKATQKHWYLKHRKLILNNCKKIRRG